MLSIDEVVNEVTRHFKTKGYPLTPIAYGRDVDWQVYKTIMDDWWLVPRKVSTIIKVHIL